MTDTSTSLSHRHWRYAQLLDRLRDTPEYCLRPDENDAALIADEVALNLLVGLVRDTEGAERAEALEAVKRYADSELYPGSSLLRALRAPAPRGGVVRTGPTS
jgi:hypothetical protein